MDLTLATIAAMCRQEESGYLVVDSLKHQQQQHLSRSSLPSHLAAQMIDEECRTKMAGWCYQVVDFCKFHRETVEIAMNFLDRYVCTPAGHAAFLDRKVYQLAAMTCLYTAVKIHEPEAMDPNLVSNLSRGTYTPAQIEQMEASILMALQWRVNPPTALAFVRQFLELIPDTVMGDSMRQTVYDLTKYQTELAVNEYDFMTVRSSTVAFCSLMNSLESVGINDKILLQIGNGLSQSIGLYGCHQNDSVLDIQNWLYEAVVRQPIVGGTVMMTLHPPARSQDKPHRRSSFEVSPRSISSMR